ncbi:hypothetical protein FDO65_07085 [Nakamurella flava]|uniref:Uncharacterized protein n=1 Tax=Nakamurella flava TaxID=2576308 RepID=A0A4U6QLE8_9ACTN|nr:hypothetical protein [Nakamurella flava]TKV61354.1 hypothetical protein FDO65_07085 [Nakamurella flava]
MIQLPPGTRRPHRSSRQPATNDRPRGTATLRPVPRPRHRGTTLAALVLATGLLVGGVAALAPYADPTDQATLPSSVVDGH